MKMLNGAPKPPRAGTLMARSIRTKSADGDALGSERAR